MLCADSSFPSRVAVRRRQGTGELGCEVGGGTDMLELSPGEVCLESESIALYLLLSELQLGQKRN